MSLIDDDQLVIRKTAPPLHHPTCVKDTDPQGNEQVYKNID